MALINEEDFASSAALKAPLELAENVEELIVQNELLINNMRELRVELDNDKLSMTQLGKAGKALEANEKALLTVQNALTASLIKETNAAKGTSSSMLNLEKSLKANVDAYKKLATEEQRATAEGKKLLSVIQQQSKDLGVLNAKLKEATTDLDKGGKSSSGFGDMLKKAGAAAAGFFALDKIKDFVGEVIRVTAEFQKLEAVLTTALGSKSAAQQSLKMIKDFAASTPFDVAGLTESYVKLVNQGFKPSIQELTKLGDLSASTGKEFKQLTEAVIDAQTGEFERLKEFGIRAKKQGDEVQFTFKGVQTQVKFTSAEIRNYIVSLGAAEGISGSMAAISKTLGGQISNLGDSWDSFLATLGEGNSGILSGTVNLLNKALSIATKLVTTTEQQNKADAVSKAGAVLERFKALTNENEAEAYKEKIYKRILALQIDQAKSAKQINNAAIGDAKALSNAALRRYIDDKEQIAILQTSLGLIHDYQEETIAKVKEQGAEENKYLKEITAAEAALGAMQNKLIEDRAKASLEVSKLKEQELKVDGEDRIKVLEQQQSIEENLANQELKYAQANLSLSKLKLLANEKEKDGLKNISEAQASVYKAQEDAYQAEVKYGKLIKSERDQMAKEKEDADKKRIEDDKKALKERIEAATEAATKEYLIAKEGLDKQAEAIREQVRNHVISKEDGDKKLKALETNLKDDYIQLAIDRMSKILEVEGLTAEERLKIEEKLASLKADLNAALYEELGATEDDYYAKLQEKIAAISEAFQMFADSVGMLFQSFTDKRLLDIEREEKASKKSFDAQREAAKKTYDEETERAGDNKVKKEKAKKDYEKAVDALDKEREKKDTELANRRGEAQAKQARYEKRVALAQAAIQVALAVAKMLTAGPFIGQALAAATAIAGGIQIAAIAARPIPEYAKGTKNHPGGLAIVGDGEGAELVKHNGKYSLTPAVPTVVDLPSGAEVIPHEKSMSILAANNLRNLPHVDKQGGHHDAKTYRQLQKLTSAVENKKHVEVVIGRNVEKMFVDQNMRTKILNDLCS